MPDIEFDPIHKTAQRVDFDAFKLRKDEKARIAVLDGLKYVYVHNFRAPEFENGTPKKRYVQRRGQNELVLDLGFVGRPQCLGDYGIIKQKGYDPTNCPGCAAVDNHPDWFDMPEKRYGMNVVRYATNREGKLLQPFSCGVQVWIFGDKMFNKLIDVKEIAGDLAEHDLVLTCEVEMYQNYTIVPAGEAIWNARDDIRERVVQTLAANKVDDVEGAIARRPDMSWLHKDIQSVIARWNTYQGAQQHSTGGKPAQAPLSVPDQFVQNGAGRASLDTGLAGLFDGPQQPAPVGAPAVGVQPPPVDLDAMVASLPPTEPATPTNPPAAQQPAPAQPAAAQPADEGNAWAAIMDGDQQTAPAPAAQPATGGGMNFSELLNSL